jgi:hypothetical protein
MNNAKNSCINDPKCPGIQGVTTCSNFAWGACTAVSPIAEITISSPDEGREYQTCDNTISIPINYSSPEGSVCKYKINANPYAIMTTSITAQLGKNTLIIRCNENEFKKIVSFTATKRQDCKTITQSVDKSTTDAFTNEGYTAQEIKDAVAIRKIRKEYL